MKKLSLLVIGMVIAIDFISNAIVMVTVAMPVNSQREGEENRRGADKGQGGECGGAHDRDMLYVPLQGTGARMAEVHHLRERWTESGRRTARAAAARSR